MSSRVVAVTFIALLLVSSLPPTSATHTGALAPDAPTLPHLRPSQDCTQTSLAPSILARVNDLTRGDPAFYQDDVGTPAVCINGASATQVSALVTQMDLELERLRNASREIQRQVDLRVETTLPEGSAPCTPASQTTDAEVPLACGLVEPKTILLEDTFNGRRTTGFGDWNVVTAGGEDPLWHLESVATLNGTRTTYRFGDDTGYARGAHQWLVSPEIDLSSLKANKTAIQDLVAARDLARSRMRTACYEGIQNFPGDRVLICSNVPSDRNPTPQLTALVTAYELAFDETINEMPVMQHGAFLDVSYRMNFAQDMDGVRVWLYSGDRAPDRSVLFDPRLGMGEAAGSLDADSSSCAHAPVAALSPAVTTIKPADTLNGSIKRGETAPGNLTCTAQLVGGRVINDNVGGNSWNGSRTQVRAFQSSEAALNQKAPRALSGDLPEFHTQRFNLTDHLDQRVWLLFEAKTTRNDRGTDIFSDPGTFKRSEGFGFELSRVYAEGDGYLRNLRLKDIGATFPYAVPGNAHGDGRNVRSTVPPGNESIRVYLHNAGDYTENATFTLNVAEARPGTTSFLAVGAYAQNVTLLPDEVKTLAIPWSQAISGGNPLKEGYLYRLTGALALPQLNVTVGGLTNVTPSGNLPPGLEPNNTRVRPANAAGTVPGAGNVTLEQLVRSATARDLEAVRVDGEMGSPLQFCSAIDGRKCVELYAARKGESRIAYMGVRNVGNAPQDITADLLVTLDGVAKDDIITGGPRVTMQDMRPGETRPAQWTINPTEPGAYRVAVALTRSDGVVEPLVERRLFVQRTTGLICLDTIDTRECGPTYTGGLVPLLANEDITASALGTDGTLYVATEINELGADASWDGILAARSPAGVWRTLANITPQALDALFPGNTYTLGDGTYLAWEDVRSIVPAPDGNLYLVGGSSIFGNGAASLFHYNATNGKLTLIPIVPGGTTAEPAPVRVALTSAMWHEGTLWAAGTNGTLLRLVNGSMARVLVENRTGTTATAAGFTTATYTGTIRALAQAPNGDGFLLGDGGVLLRHPRGEAATVWRETETIGAFETELTAWQVGNATLRAAGIHDGRFYVAGEGVLLVNKPGSSSFFLNVTQPAPQQRLTLPGPRNGMGFTEFISVASSHLGALEVLDFEGRLAVCDACVAENPDWYQPELARPPVVGKGTAHPARISRVLADATQTLLVGEAGLVLDLRVGGDYEDLQDWTTVPALAAHDGGVLQTRRGSSPTASEQQTFLSLPDAAGQVVGNEATEFRLFLNHTVKAATNASQLQVRVVYVNFPSFAPVAGTQTSQTSIGHTCGQLGTESTVSEKTVCGASRVRHLVTSFTAPSPVEAWEPRTFTGIPSARVAVNNVALPDAATAGPAFYALEFYEGMGTRWALDDWHLQGLVGGKWETVVEWRGPSAYHGSFFLAQNTSSFSRETLTPITPSAPREIPLAQVNASPAWEFRPVVAFDASAISPWHVTTQYADRPVLAANNEFYVNDQLSGGSLPRLYSGWDSRLVSPVIDLRDAYDPAVTFRHKYAFRMQVLPNASAPGAIRAGDGGFLEVQYLRQGAECGSTDVTVTCGWSPFYAIQPEGGYPDKTDVGYYDRPYTSGSHSIANRIGVSDGGPANKSGVGLSYWGRTAYPDESGVIGSTRLTDTYETARVVFEDVKCKASQSPSAVDCVPVNLSGRQIRFAFHLLTHGDWSGNVPPWAGDTVFNASAGVLNYPASYPGEGWFITDFKVLGARQLGIDLAATNATFRVGYDFARIGVGPGTRVPVNVTVENRGIFDALGYTGKLEVHRVNDRALKNTTLVETITLPQQPVLDADPAGLRNTRNHTLIWNVPATEGAEYVLTFTATPIGIDRDEDAVDNVVRIGSVAQPILAKTTRQFSTEFLVSPQNATIDITRYVPMFLNNTGNVPLDGFTVERRITVIGRQVDSEAQTCAQWRQYVLERRQTAIVDCRQFVTTRAAPAGALTPLTALTDDISPTTDLFWKAPERANFLINVNAQTTIGGQTLVSGLDRRVSAFATYLFDDVEGGPRGESDSGAWTFGEGWNATQPGFRSTDSYAFGDPLLARYPADANDSIVSPVIDLGNARTASIAFYHKYRFEEGFDGGVVEASVDNGRTWTPLPVASDSLTTIGYNRTHAIQPGSPLHPDGNPDHAPVYAFTSDSSKNPAAVDGWGLSTIDLTQYANVTESRVPYEAYTSIEIGSYSAPPVTLTRGVNTYSKEDWCVGPADEFRCWEVQNLTQATLVPPTSPVGSTNTMWWSGSAMIEDDGVRPIQNHLLTIPLDVTGVEEDHVVTAEWWEYASRFGMGSVYLTDGEQATTNWDPSLYTAYTFHSGSLPAHTTRYNLGQPEIIETRGKWYHMKADITDLVERAKVQDGRSTYEVAFSYTPYAFYATAIHDGSAAGDNIDAIMNATESQGAIFGKAGEQRYLHDPGFAIDGFHVTATRLVRGQPLGAPLDLATEASAWDAKAIYECSTGHELPNATNPWQGSTAAVIACLHLNGPFVRHTDQMIVKPTADDPRTGRNWALVTELPDFEATWQVVPVVDETRHSANNTLPTGHTPTAWWTGQLPAPATRDLNPICASVHTTRCVLPGSESRLVTPAFDLGRVAGDNAQLTFTHRYAFSDAPGANGGTPLASGGVVEIQEFDPQAGAWKPWRQLYAEDGFYRGYSAMTANTSEGANGVVRFDPPFENVVIPGRTKAVQFLWSGNSTDFTGEQHGWQQETFDVHDYIGKRVRFGFHAYFSDELLATQAVAQSTLDGPDTTSNALGTPLPNDPADNRGGWWVKDVSLIGNVIVGKPVQIRWRAASDGNVQEGSWQIDDIGAFGSRYRNNVGLFVDTTSDAHGAYNASVATIPVTVRNLGDSVRRDLAIEVRNTVDSVELNFTAPNAPGVGYSGSVFRMTGITLAPGQSATIDLKVRTPAQAQDAHVPLLLELKEFSASSPDEPYLRIVDNEVQGLLTRIVPFTLQREPTITMDGMVVRQRAPQVGDAVDIELAVSNAGFGPSTLNLTCRAMTITDYAPMNHLQAGAAEAPIVAPGTEQTCALVGGSLTVPAKGHATLTYRATARESGFLAFVVNGSVTGGKVLPAQRAGIAVGVPSIARHWGFDSARELSENFSVTQRQGGWDHLRGNDRPGAMYIGLKDNDTGRSGSYNAQCGSTACRAVSVEVDLHNYSRTSPAFLSFWHMDRLARYDGARVVASVHTNEQKTGEDAWSPKCILTPREGWEGSIKQVRPVPEGTGTTVGNTNSVFNQAPAQYPNTDTPTPDEFFTSHDGVWEESWDLEVFDLTKPCVRLDDRMKSYYLTGNATRFEFEVFGGQYVESPQLTRGRGQGMFVDDITIGPHSIDVRPLTAQRATLLDNTTKPFKVVVQNDGTAPDLVRLEYDAANSSAPAGSVVVPADAFELAPGERRVVTGLVTLPRDPSLLPTEFGVRLVARSVVDRNAAGATTVDIGFAPRQWAELAIAVESPGNVVQEGTEAFLPITLENLGLVESVNTTIRITDTWATGSTTIDIPISGIPAYATNPEDSTRVVEFRWRPEKGAVGVHTLTFQVDPDALGEEYTKSNNRATIAVPVSDLLIPDLHVANFSALSLRNAMGGTVSPAFDADVARYEVTAGELVSFEVKVANVGRAGATNVDVRAFLGALSLPPKTIPYIAPGTEVVVTFNWLAQKGEHEIEFVVRSEQVELTNANNRYPGTAMTLLTVKGYEVEVAIPDLAALLEPGSVVEVPFSVTNAGNAGEDLVLLARSPEGTTLTLPREGFFLRAGETYSDKARLVLDAAAVAGQQVISIDAVARENPMKVASGRAAMRVNASYGGSVAGGLAAGAPPGFVIPVELVNEGNSLEPWSVTVRLPDGWTSVEPMPVKVAVPAHGKTKLDLHVNVPATTAPGERVMQVKAQLPNGMLRDGLVRASVSPLRAAGVLVSDKAPLPVKGALSVPVVVENRGNVQQPFEMLVLDAPAGLTLRMEPATFDLPPGGKAVAALVVTPNASVEAGTYSITSYALFEGLTPQTSEGRANLQTIRVPIVRQDLRLSPLEFTPRAGLDAGDRVSVKVSLTNRGLTELTDVPVHLFADDLFIDESIVPSIAAGARVDVTFNWTATLGAHTLTAVADPYSDTVDGDRADNAVSALATVGDEAATGAVAAGRADTPAPGPLGLLIAALAAALLVTQRNGSRRQRR